MGMVTNVLPTTMSAVKASGIGSSQNSLRAYLIGGAAGVDSNTAGHLGFIPSTGTVNLSRFRDATRANTLNTSYSYSGGAYGHESFGPSQTVTFTFGADGSMGTTADGQGESWTSRNESFANRWLIRTGSNCLANTCGNWEIKFTKTSGVATPTNNNTWVALSTSRILSVSASAAGDDSMTWNMTCNVQIRRADTQVIVRQTNITVSATAQSYSGPQN